MCQALFALYVPTLLVTKFVLRHRISWWLVVFASLLLSTALGIALDRLGPYAHFERYESCFRVAGKVAEIECGGFTYDVAILPIWMKWIPGLALLVLLLPFYGLALWFRKRRQRASVG
jgi:hypothetical protein